MFMVDEIVDGDTFGVNPGWEWGGKSGTRVRPTGYDAPELSEPGGQAAKQKLAGLILGKAVDLRNCKTVSYGRLVCDVYVNGHNLADYFPEYQ